MSDINKALGSAGAPLRLKCGDITYLVSDLTKGVQAAFGEWVKSRAREAVHAIRREVDAKTYAAALSEFCDKVAAGVYGFGKPLCREALGNMDGMAQLMYLLMRPCQPAITEEEVADLFERFPDEIAACIKEMTASKNAAAPATATPPG